MLFQSARLDRIAAFAPGLHPSVKRGHATEAKLGQGRRRQGGNLAEFPDRQDFEIRIGKGLVDPDLELAAREVTRTRHMAAPIGVAFAHVEDHEIVALPADPPRKLLQRHERNGRRRLGQKLPHRLAARDIGRSEEHTSELQSLMRISYAVFCLKKKKNTYTH